MKRPNRQRLAQLSRDRNFLVKAGLIIAIVSVALGFVISMTSKGLAKLDPPTEDSPLAAVADADAFAQVATMVRDPMLYTKVVLKINGFDPEEFFRRYSMGAPVEPELEVENPETSLEDRALAFVESAEDRLTEPEYELLTRFAIAMYAEDERASGAYAAIRRLAAVDPPPRHAHELLGDLAMMVEKDAPLALNHYRAEVETFADTVPPERLRYPAKQLLELLVRTGQPEASRKALITPLFRSALNGFDQLDISILIPSYPGIFRGAVFNLTWRYAQWPLAILSGIAALIWGTIIAKFSGFDRSQLARYAAAFLLGLLSTVATLFVVIVQDDVLGFGANEYGDVGSQVIYWIAGVGLREELCKLLLFAPLVPFLLRKSDAEVLVCAGLVGLGFAFQENIGYYHREGAGWGRFFTANFVHLSLTGIAGLALVRGCRWPKTHWDNALMGFLFVVALHGAYDAAIIMPFFGNYGGIISFLLMATIAYFYLHPLRASIQMTRALAISPLGVFVIGAALLCGITFCYSCWGVPLADFTAALSGYIASVAGLLPIAFMYINQFRDL